MKQKTDTKKTIFRILFTALFIALTFAGTSIMIQVGPSKIHLGNLVSIIAGLLMGPWIGGVSGSLGMGFNDISTGLYGPDTIIRTFVVKFIVGFAVGFLFRYFIKKKKKVNWIYILIVSVFAVAFLFLLIMYILHGNAFTVGGKTFKNPLFTVISLGVISVFFGVLLILSSKIKPLQQYVLLSTSIAVVLNIVLEFALKIPLKMAFGGYTLEAAIVSATTSLPAALITGIITIAFVTFIYCPIYFATARINKLNDLYNEIQEITGFKNEEEKEEKATAE